MDLEYEGLADFLVIVLKFGAVEVLFISSAVVCSSIGDLYVFVFVARARRSGYPSVIEVGGARRRASTAASHGRKPDRSVTIPGRQAVLFERWVCAVLNLQDRIRHRVLGRR